MQEVADWLERLGLGQYARRFAENDISFSILSDLTDQDLEKIGVASLAHRRLLLREIANLGETPDGAPSAPSFGSDRPHSITRTEVGFAGTLGYSWREPPSSQSPLGGRTVGPMSSGPQADLPRSGNG
jgi:hypothetical protein